MLNYHSHSHYEIFVLTKGSRTVFLENNAYNLAEDSILLIPPSISHKMYGESYSRYTVDFTDNYLDDFQRSVINQCARQVIHIEEYEKKEIYDLLKRMYNIRIGCFPPPNFEFDKDYLIHTCFSFLIFLIANLKNYPKEIYQPTKKYPLRIQKIITYITENIHQKITLDDIAKYTFVSKTTLCKDFKKTVGTSIADYILGMRLDNAKDMLATTKKPIRDVAETCGFSSQNYFCLIFTKKMHMSPMQYRRYFMPKIGGTY